MFMEKFKNCSGGSIYHPEEIAGVIARFTDVENRYNTPEDLQAALTDCLYQLFATCQNEYNPDYYRVFYVALSDMINELLYNSGLNQYNYLLYGDEKGVE